MNKATQTLADLFLSELKDMYDAEHRLVRALPKMAKAASCPDLQAAFTSHLKETQGHITKLDQVFKSIGEKPQAKKCEATAGLLKEGDEIAAEFKGSPAIDAALISAGQKVEHYEIASYGCLRSWALALDRGNAATLIEEILEQEKAADLKLSKLAQNGINQSAEEVLHNGETPKAGKSVASKRRQVETVSNR